MRLQQDEDAPPPTLDYASPRDKRAPAPAGCLDALLALVMFGLVVVGTVVAIGGVGLFMWSLIHAAPADFVFFSLLVTAAGGVALLVAWRIDSHLARGAEPPGTA